MVGSKYNKVPSNDGQKDSKTIEKNQNDQKWSKLPNTIEILLKAIKIGHSGGWSYSAKNDEDMIKTYQTTVKTSKTINHEND